MTHALLSVIAAIANFAGSFLLYWALQVEAVPTREEYPNGVTVDRSTSSFMGVPVGKLAVVKSDHPYFVPAGILLLCFGIGTQLGVGASEFFDARKRGDL